MLSYFPFRRATTGGINIVSKRRTVSQNVHCLPNKHKNISLTSKICTTIFEATEKIFVVPNTQSGEEVRIRQNVLCGLPYISKGQCDKERGSYYCTEPVLLLIIYVRL